MDNKIKVVQLQYATESGGSAALRLHKAFLNSNVDSTIVSLIADDVSGLEKTVYLGKFARFISKIDNRIQQYITKHRIKDYGLFSFPVLGNNVSQLEAVKNADFIYIHWALNGFLNLKSIRQIAKLNKPVIIFMHDMWPITGGCHYSFSCEKYTSRCNSCQMFLTSDKNDLSESGFDKKAKLYSEFNNLFFVAPSKWLYNCAKQSALTKTKPAYYIPNLLDNSIFKPFDKITAKQSLNIDSDELVIAFGAVSIESPYKGWPFLQNALEILYQEYAAKKVTILIFGSGYTKQISEKIPFKTKFMGYLRDEYSRAIVYNAADVFIAPSLVEAFGYVIMESLFCGTPVVGFEVGGIPDMINHKENGYIAKYKDAEDVSNGIKYCLENKLTGSLSPDFNSKSTVNRHLDLLEKLKTTVK